MYFSLHPTLESAVLFGVGLLENPGVPTSFKTPKEAVYMVQQQIGIKVHKLSVSSQTAAKLW